MDISDSSINSNNSMYLYFCFLVMQRHSVAGSIFGGIGVFTLFGGVVGNIDDLTKNDDLTNSSDHHNN